MRQEKLEIDQQLRAIHGNAIGSVQNFPLQRRSDRGYSSDIDSMRSNRGGAGGSQSNQGAGGLRGRGGRGGRGNNPRYHPGNNLHNNIDSNRFNNITEHGPSTRPKFVPRGGARGGRRGGNSSHSNGRLQAPATRGSDANGPDQASDNNRQPATNHIDK